MQTFKIHASAADDPVARVFRRLHAANHAPRCHHVKTNGLRCGSPALAGKTYCYFHHRLRCPRPAQLGLPPLEDAASVQFALMRITEAILHKELDPRTAGLLLYALQIASSNLKRVALEPNRTDVVLSDPQEGPPGEEPLQFTGDPHVPVAPGGSLNPPVWAVRPAAAPGSPKKPAASAPRRAARPQPEEPPAPAQPAVPQPRSGPQQ